VCSTTQRQTPSNRRAARRCPPAPYTLHPTPYTLHPTPYTLHPTPYTLHPTPYTLHPKRCDPLMLTSRPPYKVAITDTDISCRCTHLTTFAVEFDASQAACADGALGG